MRYNVVMNSKITAMNMQFSLEFNKEWDRFLKSFDLDLSSARQLHIGNHMRPQLVFWGYMLRKDIFSHINYTEIARLAVSVEAIHKASVIIDDIIDDDTKRRGEACMHRIYGEYQTVFFAVCMLAQSISQLVECLHSDRLEFQSNMIHVLCDTILSMCTGAIKEISASTEQQVDLSYVQQIIDCETAQLIKNSLYVGFLANDTQDNAVADILCTIGSKCGYVFQVMNDLEPFCNPQYIKQYKGSINADVSRSRKSIILPHLYQACSPQEKEHLFAYITMQDSFDSILTLFNKYEIRAQTMEELEDIYNSILTLLTDINNLGYGSWAEAFRVFVEFLRKKYMSVLYSGQKGD